MSKVLKIIAIIAAVAAVIAGICICVKKLTEKKNAVSDEENYVSCSCEEDFVSESKPEETGAAE